MGFSPGLVRKLTFPEPAPCAAVKDTAAQAGQPPVPAQLCSVASDSAPPSLCATSRQHDRVMSQGAMSAEVP